MNFFPGEYVTLTFVVRHSGDLEEPEDPRTLLTNDEVMWWGSEPGITQHAITQGADLSSWHEDVKTTTACRHCGHGIGYSDTEKTWVAPDAGFDVEGGDGMWRDMCPDRDDEINPPHEPMTADLQTCVEAGEHVITQRHPHTECPVKDEEQS